MRRPTELEDRCSSALFESQSARGEGFTYTPPPPYASNRNFEIAICSKIAQRSYNKAFEVDRISQSLGVMVASYTSGAYKVFIEGMVV